MAFKIRQNAFPAAAPPKPRWGSLRLTVPLGRGHSPHIPALHLVEALPSKYFCLESP